MTRKKIIITGASSGIGKALAEEFYAKGYDLGLMARREAILETMSKELTGKGNVYYHTIDLADDTTIEANLNALINKMGGMDIFVANAGITDITPTGKGLYPRAKEIIMTNLVGTIASIDAAVAYFRTQKKGQIVGISSVSAFRGIPGSGSYSGSKAGLTNYLDALEMELLNKNIKITAIHPGFIKTNIHENVSKAPFAIDADVAAKKMAKAIEKQKKDVTIPFYPWALLRYFLQFIPSSMMRKMF